jgi:PRTRC genetic system protein B
VLEQRDSGLFDEGCESIEDAAALLRHLQDCVAAREWMRAWAERHQAEAAPDVDRLEADLDRRDTTRDGPLERAWAQWIHLVCQRARIMNERHPSDPMDPQEGQWDLGVLFTIDPGVPWHERLASASSRPGSGSAKTTPGGATTPRPSWMPCSTCATSSGCLPRPRRTAMPVIEGYDLGTPKAARPAAAVVFHQGERQQAVTYHELAVGDAGASIRPGRAMTRADATGLLRALLGDRTGELVWSPAQVLSQGEDSLVWYVPGKVRRMFFAATGGQTLTLEAPWPTLLFAAREQTLRLAAIKGRGRPTPRTPLYHAPLMNLYADGRVCLGSATVPMASGFETMVDFEAAIFDTRFSHGNFRGNLAYRQGEGGATKDQDHIRFWRDLAKDKASRFPNQVLVPIGRRLESFLAA